MANHSLTRQQLGAAGEAAAAHHLIQRGYIVIERNWRCPTGELDLILRDGETLVFVEVRTCSGHETGIPEESITPRKREQLVHLAYTYFDARAIDADTCEWRIDVVAVEMNRGGRVMAVRHITNAIDW